MSDPAPASDWGSWSTIPAYRSFVDDLASGIIERWGSDPLSLADLLVLVPNRRSARALTEALLTASGQKSMLLPQIRTLGDLDEGESPFEPGQISLQLPPAIKPLPRLFELAAIVDDFFRARDQIVGFTHRLDLAEALGQFLDSLQIEEVEPPETLHDLAGPEMAAHWELSADLITRVLKEWPKRLNELGLIEPMQRRTLLLKALAEQWTQTPPSHPILAAGSTGSVKATADLLGVIARCPKGHVVLPGLDQGLDDAGWAAVEDQHPQNGLKRLLSRMGLDRGQVQAWRHTADVTGRWRTRVINEALRPADRTADWLTKIAALRDEVDAGDLDPIREGLRGLTLIDAAHEREAAVTIALLMREGLNTPHKRIALITPDLQLSQRVQFELARWGLSADSSSGVSLTHSPVAILVGLVCDWVVSPLDPVLWLALLKHPLVRLGLATDGSDSALKELELQVFRKVHPTSLDMLLSRIAQDGPALAVVDALTAILEPLSDLAKSPEAPKLVDCVSALALGLENLTKDPETLEPEVWSGPDGEAVAALFADIIDLGAQTIRIGISDLSGLLSRLISRQSMPLDQDGHPRLKILGTIEARLVGADQLILAGLEEGIWPRTPGTDPLLSRPLRASLGLPSPERRIGLSAHDFSQAASAPEVVMVHTTRRDHAPSIPSRWIWRLKTLIKGAGLEVPGRPDMIALARSLDSVDGPLVPVTRPVPCPPLADRPRKLAVTRVEALVNNPYGVWARDIAKLRVLDPPGGVFDVRGRGTAVHKAIETFSGDWPYDDMQTAVAHFERLYLDEIAEFGARATDLAHERPLAQRLGAWLYDYETRRRPGINRLFLEKEGQLVFQTGSGPFTLTAKSDRLELDSNGHVHIIDFKTGSPPSEKQVKQGYSPQLTLTAAIVEAGGFNPIGKKEAGDLTYVKVTGRKPAGVETRVDKAEASSIMAKTALEGLVRLIERYDDPTSVYAASTLTGTKNRIDDYLHLSRRREWGLSAEADSDSEP